MTIPLDNLYHYIEGLFPKPVCMYLFYPHGSKNILDLQGLNKHKRIEHGVSIAELLPSVICHDQEPLNYRYYENHPSDLVDRAIGDIKVSTQFRQLMSNSNLKLFIPPGVYDRALLLHSEKNSHDLKTYEQNGYVGVYYWAHAIIAQDWFRFACCDPRLAATATGEKDFLIYCRDWSGTREYRVKFQEILYQAGLHNQCVTSIMLNNSEGVDITDFIPTNKNFSVENFSFLSHITDNCASSSSSAGYDPEDFKHTKISIVLETVFDDARIHLTEKILRPIACGHPFMLAAGAGGLQYLRDYGFKTFSPYINEDYDLETDSVERMKKIVSAMSEFSSLPDPEKIKTWHSMVAIAKYNQERFFSTQFTNDIFEELQKNIKHALHQIKHSRGQVYRSRPKSSDSARRAKRKIVIDAIRNLKKSTDF